MKKLIIKMKGCLTVDDRERFETDLKKQLDENGFAVVDDWVDIYEIDDGNEAEQN